MQSIASALWLWPSLSLSAKESERVECCCCFCLLAMLRDVLGHLSWLFLLFGHRAAFAQINGARGVCVDPLELSASFHDVKIDLLDGSGGR
jgi:hypothetical protein